MSLSLPGLSGFGREGVAWLCEHRSQSHILRAVENPSDFGVSALHVLGKPTAQPLGVSAPTPGRPASHTSSSQGFPILSMLPRPLTAPRTHVLLSLFPAASHSRGAERPSEEETAPGSA
ncbi:hypothetical protein CYJ25_02390 [Schaalia turicensis]|uniref:Uncharacterized protein n=1 Tax=Schaalia turicensis TaxID=131111 RepID=A0A2I1I7J2_9ACTO|nr:hypothetical protein [Schaalia turicensis]PKY67099.1 hypothetical protein CYJ25_02390 [Schaalia turicensis]